MRRLIPLLAALALATGCGDDDDGDLAPQGATGAGGTPFEMTVGRFIDQLQPEKQSILDGYVAAIPACKGVKVDPGFVLLVTAAALDTDQDRSLEFLVEEQC